MTKTVALSIFVWAGILQQLTAQNRIFPAEFEYNEGVLLTWDYAPSRDSVVANIAKGLQDVTTVWIIYYPGPAPYDTNYIRNYLLLHGVGYHNVKFVPGWTETLWIRDYGPITGYRFTGESWERFFLDARYSKYNRPKDDSIPAQLGRLWGIPVVQFPLEVEGGNLILDGTGNGFGSKRIFTQNPGLPQNQVKSLFLDYLGLNDFYFIDVLENSGGGIWMHVDMFMKMVDNQTILVSSYPSYLPDYPIIEGIAQQLSQMTNQLGVNYKVVRIPAPPKSDGTYATTLNDEMRTYTNSLTTNGVVVVPKYNHPLDDTARAIYQRNMPGYQIRMVDARTLTPLYGAIHCVTREICKPNLLRILHVALKGLQPYEPCKLIRCRVQAAASIDSVVLYYRKNSENSFTALPMQPESGNYVASLCGLQPGDTVQYYLHASDTIGNASDPAMAPGIFHEFVLNPETLGKPENTVSECDFISIEGKYFLRFRPAAGEKVLGMRVLDLYGRELFNQQKPEHNIMSLGSLAQGWYIGQVITNQEIYTRKFFVKR
ncbi:MAG: agmatine deiminase family protein [Bacteroidales bacterium]